MSKVVVMAAHYVDEGLRVLLAEDSFIYVVNESDDLVYCYESECWPEWSRARTVAELIPFAHNYQPSRLAKQHLNYCRARGVEDQMTLSEWENETE